MPHIQKKILSVAVIGGGLAGCECAMRLARSGISVRLFEMKPERFSEAHGNENLAELVCSNSFRSAAEDAAIGVLKMEMRALGSLCLEVADETSVPAGKALAVDRELFSAKVTERIAREPRITLYRREVLRLEADELDALAASLGLAPFDAVVVAAGPLAGKSLAASLAGLAGEEQLYFYDAIAPVVDAASIDLDIAFWGARHQPDDRDYLNCPMNEAEYTAFHQALLDGEKVQARDFEREVHFEGCMPVEALAARGFKTLAFGSLKPVGFIDPRSGRRPFALLQLRAENANKSMFNLVGCQTKLTYAEQRRVFRMIPGLGRAEFVRFGSMHRNTFVNAPKVLAPDLSLRSAPRVFLAGQITGVEGYMESAACGLWLGHLLAARAAGRELADPPAESAIGGLIRHLRHAQDKHGRFQPSNVQFGLTPELGQKAGKSSRKTLYAERARAAFAVWLGDALP